MAVNRSALPQSGLASDAPPGVTAGPGTDHALDLIFIEGLVGETVIGIHDTELHRPQPLVIDICAGTPRPRACDTDQIADTIDYGALRTRIHRLLQEHSVKLLEAFAEQIARITIDEFGAHWVRVRVAKPRKFDDVQAVGVQIERRRQPDDLAGRPMRNMLHLIGSGMVPERR